MQSLSSLALSRLPVQDYSLLVREGYVLPEEYGSWATWRERAVKDFGISGEYFDLPHYDYPKLRKRNISPQYRYLEIQTKFYLSPESAVSLSSDGEINGIYESLTGVYESLRRNDAEMVLFFAQRLKPDALTVIKREITKGSILHQVPNYRPGGYDIFYFRTAALRTLSSYLFGNKSVAILKKAGLYPERWQMATEEQASSDDFSPHRLGNRQQLKLALLHLISLGKKNVFQYSKDILKSYNLDGQHVSNTVLNISNRELLLAALASGDIDLFEEVKQYLFVTQFRGLPLVMEVLADIPLFLKGIAYNAPFKIDISKEVSDSIIYGGNPRIFLYVRGYSKNPFSYNSEVAFSGYYLHNNPQGFFSINSLYAKGNTSTISSDLDIDYYSQGTEDDNLYPLKMIVLKNLGYIELVSSFYPLLDRHGRQVIKNAAGSVYPLSSLIMQNLDKSSILYRLGSDVFQT